MLVAEIQIFIITRVDVKVVGDKYTTLTFFVVKNIVYIMNKDECYKTNSKIRNN